MLDLLFCIGAGACFGSWMDSATAGWFMFFCAGIVNGIGADVARALKNPRKFP